MPKVPEEQLTARRGEILSGARRAFARHGYECATVKVLEAETGLSRGAIFHHFRDKQALFLALAEQDATRTADVVEQAGLVHSRRQGRYRLHHLDTSPLRAVVDRWPIDREASP